MRRSNPQAPTPQTLMQVYGRLGRGDDEVEKSLVVFYGIRTNAGTLNPKP